MVLHWQCSGESGCNNGCWPSWVLVLGTNEILEILSKKPSAGLCMYMVISLVLSQSFIAYMFFPIQFSPILKLPRGKGTSETRLLPGKERPVAGSQGGELSHGLLPAQNHSALLSPSPGHWPKGNCRSESLHKACNGYRCGNTLSQCVTHGDLLWAQMWMWGPGKFNLLVL